MYRDNTPTFNAGNRRLVNFKGFKPEEEKELRDIQKSQLKKNDPNAQSQEHRRKNRWNKVTHKIEDLHPSEVDDKLDELDGMKEGNKNVVGFNKFQESLDPMGSWKTNDQSEDEDDDNFILGLSPVRSEKIDCESILKEVLELSDFHSQGSADDMQISLEKIWTLIKGNYPHLTEKKYWHE